MIIHTFNIRDTSAFNITYKSNKFKVNYRGNVTFIIAREMAKLRNY